MFHPALAAAHANLGAAYVQQGDYGQASVHLEIVTRLEPASAEAHYNLGLVQSRQGETAPAREEFEAAIALAPDSPWAALARNRKGRNGP